jgi:peptide-methionine (S)-S-oxide reductase
MHSILLAGAVLVGLAGPVGAAGEKGPEPATLETAIFAGGCFWCVEEAFDKVQGVVETISGYTGGQLADPSYEQVSAGGTGHREAVEVRFDPAQVRYGQLLETFWHNIDPLDAGGQFCDRGQSYESAIYVTGPAQQAEAESSKGAVASQLGEPAVTPILPASRFYPAEAYHQDYHNQNPLRYRYYKWGCGRAQRLEQIWGKPTS